MKSDRIDIKRSRKPEHYDAGIIRGAGAYPMLGAISQEFVVDSGSLDEPNLTEVSHEKDSACRRAGDNYCDCDPDPRPLGRGRGDATGAGCSNGRALGR